MNERRTQIEETVPFNPNKLSGSLQKLLECNAKGDKIRVNIMLKSIASISEIGDYLDKIHEMNKSHTYRQDFKTVTVILTLAEVCLLSMQNITSWIDLDHQGNIKEIKDKPVAYPKSTSTEPAPSVPSLPVHPLLREVQDRLANVRDTMDGIQK